MTQAARPLALRAIDLIHADAELSGSEVAPSIVVSTTFKQPQGTRYIEEVDWRNPPNHIYSRWTQPINTRAEHVLSRINEGSAITYSSGLAAVYAALVFYQPKRIALRRGYPGSLSSIEVFRKNRSMEIELIDLDDEYQRGDLCWLETPVNPTGDSRSIQHYADKVHKVGGKLVVDSTFAPPPLQYPFRFGADCVHHSGSKYFGGHSDLLAGVLVVKSAEEWKQLHLERSFLGSTLGSLEAWLLLRSLRTLHLRVPRQSTTATLLAQWLDSIAKTKQGHCFDGVPGGVIAKVTHSSLQGTDHRGFNPGNQMQGGWNATFSIYVTKPDYGGQLPYILKYFTPATSLGGVESLIEYKHHTDATADACLIRLSIGLEDVGDLKADLRQAFQKLGNVGTLPRSLHHIPIYCDQAQEFLMQEGTLDFFVSMNQARMPLFPRKIEIDGG